MKTDRKTLLAKLHIARKELALPEDEYRAILRAQTGYESAKDIPDRQIEAMLDHFKKCGWKPARFGRKPKPANARAEHMGKVEALLADMRLPWEYAAAIARQQYKLDALEWCSLEQLRGVITALVKEQQKRRLITEVDALLTRLDANEETGAAVARALGLNPGRDWRHDVPTLRKMLRHLQYACQRHEAAHAV